MSGSRYTFTGNLSIPLIDERNLSVVDGAGHSISTKPGHLGFLLVLNDVRGVTVENLTVRNGSIAAYASTGVVLSRTTAVNGSYSLNQTSQGYNLTDTLDGSVLLLSTQGFTIVNSTFIEKGGGAGVVSSIPNQPPPFLFDGYTPPSAIAIEYSSNGSLTNDVLAANGTGVFVTEVTNLTLQGNRIASGIGTLCAGAGCHSFAYGVQAEVVTQFSEFGDRIQLPRSVAATIASADVSVSTGVDVAIQNDTLEESPVLGVDLVQVSNGAVEFNLAPRVGGTGIELLYDAAIAILENNLTCVSANASGTIGILSFSSSSLSIENNSVVNSTHAATSVQEDTADLIAANSFFPGLIPHGDGVVITNSTRLVIRNNTMGGWESNTSVAFNATGLFDSWVENNLFSVSTTGVRLVDSFDDHVLGNQILDGAITPPGAAMVLVGSASLTIAGNQLLYGRQGILAQGGGDTVVSGNNFSITLGTGVHWVDFDHLTITGNDLANVGRAVELTGGANYAITGNDLAAPYPTFPSSGLYLYHVANGVVSGNNLSTTNVGVEGSDLLNLTVADNTCYNAGFCVLVGSITNLTVQNNVGSNLLEGVEADSSIGARILGNTFGDTLSEGIGLLQSTNSWVSGNLLPHAESIGIDLNIATSPVLINNTVTLADVALDLENATTTVMTANSLVASNTSFLLRADAGVSLVHNNFENDLRWVIDGGTGGLVWDGGYPVGGNFWSNDTTPDLHSGPTQSLAGADGIHDSAFVLPGSGSDRYPLVTAWRGPTVTFVESGLPGNTPWSVNVTYGGWGSGTVLLRSSTKTATLEVPYAAFTPITYRVPSLAGYVPNTATGNSTTTSGTVSLSVPFHAFRLLLSFHATGLAAGTNWSVTVNGTRLAGNIAWLNESLPNGTYDYSILPIAGYYAVAGGVARIAGSSTVLSLTFVAVLYSMQFVEFGLPNGTVWHVSLGTTEYSVAGPVVEFHLSNGSYPFRVAAIQGFTVSPSNGTFSLQGLDRAIRISFLSIPIPPPPPPPAKPPVLEYELIGISAVLAILAAIGWMLALRRRRQPPEEESLPSEGESRILPEPLEPMPPVDMDSLTTEGLEEGSDAAPEIPR